MFKLLTLEEGHKIATRMCAEWGLPPPKITIKKMPNSSYHWDVTITVRVTNPNPNIFNKYVKEFDVDANNLEEAVEKLRTELPYKYSSRAKKAEELRNKYATAEMDELFDKEMRES